MFQNHARIQGGGGELKKNKIIADQKYTCFCCESRGEGGGGAKYRPARFSNLRGQKIKTKISAHYPPD